jgi:hypothetical protein
MKPSVTLFYLAYFALVAFAVWVTESSWALFIGMICAPSFSSNKCEQISPQGQQEATK